MRILVNRGGQQLGPFSLEELRTAVGAGQVSQQDLAWWEGAAAWVPVSQVPGFGPGIQGIPVLPTAPPPNPTQNPAAGLATASLVLGIASLFGFSCLAGIPAVICGHMALSRQKRAGYTGGSGVATAGLVTGYVGTVLITIIALLAAIAVPGFIRAKDRSMLIRSMENAKQIAAACQQYQASHNGEFPATLEDLSEIDPTIEFLVDPLDPQIGKGAYWYSKPARSAPGSTVVVASRGQSRDGKRALGHKDGSASMGPFTIPPDR